MQLALRGAKERRSRALCGFTAGLGAIGVAALTSTPVVHADSVTDLIDYLQNDFTAMQTDFSAAETDFAAGVSGVPDGLSALFAGQDNEFVIAPVQAEVGLAELLINQPVVDVPVATPEAVPADLSIGISDASTAITSGLSALQDAAAAFSTGDFLTSLVDDFSASYLLFELPVQDVVAGAIDQFVIGL